MSTTSPHWNSKRLPTRTCTSEKIRQQVDDRHWQLFELRLKDPITHTDRGNYTRQNDYRVIDRLKTNDQAQLPMEPDQRWKAFCSQVTNKSNETDRLLSIFHSVWTNNWNTKHKYEREKNRKNDSSSKENVLLQHLSRNEHDTKVISSILRQGI